MKRRLNYFSLALVFINCFAFAGEQSLSDKAKNIIVISGKISDTNNNELLAGVKISCNNCEKTFYSDLDGYFFIHLDLVDSENLKIEFSQIGYYAKSIDFKKLLGSSGNTYIDLKSK